jgi:hypothetical protein
MSSCELLHTELFIILKYTTTTPQWCGAWSLLHLSFNCNPLHVWVPQNSSLAPVHILIFKRSGFYQRRQERFTPEASSHWVRSLMTRLPLWLRAVVTSGREAEHLKWWSIAKRRFFCCSSCSRETKEPWVTQLISFQQLIECIVLQRMIHNNWQ